MLPHPHRFRALLCAAAALGAGLLSACTAPGLVLSAAGVATDSSVTWDIVKHVHAKLTADDPTPCMLLNSVQRALNPRCDYASGSIRRADVVNSGLQACPLAIATRDARLWRAVPDLIAQGASTQECSRSPLQDLAEIDACPAFASAPPAVLQAFVTMAEVDPRAVRHDIFRMLGCSNARAAGLERVLTGWLDAGKLAPGTLSFSPLAAADPELLVSRFGRELEVAGHTPEAALGGYDGVLPTGFEEALRTSHWAALDWWLYRLPQLAKSAPPTRDGVYPWLPLQRVLLPGFLQNPATQADMVGFLLARGAEPKATLPADRGRTVIAFARAIHSPMVALLDPPLAPRAAPVNVAHSQRGGGNGNAAGSDEAPALRVVSPGSSVR